MILSRQGNIDRSKGYDGFSERLNIDPFSYLIFQEENNKPTKQNQHTLS